MLDVAKSHRRFGIDLMNLNFNFGEPLYRWSAAAFGLTSKLLNHRNLKIILEVL